MFGVTSNSARLRRVAMRQPGAILEADHREWHYGGPIDAAALSQQYDLFAGMLLDRGVDVEWIPAASDDLADSIFTYDPSFVVGDAAVVMRPGKPLRVDEAELHRRFYEEVGLPILGSIESPGTIEGGDCFFIDATTIAVGRGFRTNDSGIEQFRTLVSPLGIEVRAYDLPYHHGPEACLHLMSLISPLAPDLALVHAPLLPSQLHLDLIAAGYELLAAPTTEFDASAGLNLNVLPIGPRECIAIDGFPETLAVMRAAGCDVVTFDADRLCLPCEGGPTCLTRPLWRD